MIGEISKIGSQYLVKILAKDEKEFEDLKKFKNKNIPTSENQVYMGDVEIDKVSGEGVVLWLGKEK